MAEKSFRLRYERNLSRKWQHSPLMYVQYKLKIGLCRCVRWYAANVYGTTVCNCSMIVSLLYWCWRIHGEKLWHKINLVCDRLLVSVAAWYRQYKFLPVSNSTVLYGAITRAYSTERGNITLYCTEQLLLKIGRAMSLYVPMMGQYTRSFV